MVHFSESLDAQQILASGDQAAIREELEKALGEGSPYIDALMQDTEALRENAEAYKANAEAIRVYNTQIADTYLKALSGDKDIGYENLSAKEQNQISTSMGAALDSNSEGFKNVKAEMEKGFEDGKDSKRDENAKAYAKAAGIDYQSIKWNDDGSAVFVGADGTETVASKDLMATTMAQNSLMEKQLEAAKNTLEQNKKSTEHLQAIHKNTDKQAIGANKGSVADVLLTMSAGGVADFSMLSMAQAEAIAGNKTDDAATFAKNLGFADTAALEQYAKDNGYESAAQFMEKFYKGFDNYTAATNKLTIFGDGRLFSGSQYDNLTLEAKQNINKAYSDMSSVAGSSDLKSAYESYAKTLDPASLEKFSLAFSQIDWTGPFAIEEFKNKLEESGVIIDEIGFSKFETAFSDASLSIGKMLTNLNGVKATLQTIKEIASNLEIGKEISEEDYKELIKANPAAKKHFVESLGGYTYIGGLDTDEMVNSTFNPKNNTKVINNALGRLTEWENSKVEGQSDYSTRAAWDKLFDTEEQYLNTDYSKNKDLLSLVGVSADEYNKMSPEEQRSVENTIANILYDDEGNLRTSAEILDRQSQVWLSYGAWDLDELNSYYDEGTITKETRDNFLRVRGSEVAGRAGLNGAAWTSFAEGKSADELTAAIKHLTQYALKDLNTSLKSATLAFDTVNREYEELEDLQDRLYGKAALENLQRIVEKQEEIREKEYALWEERKKSFALDRTFLSYNNEELAGLGLKDGIRYNADGTISQSTLAQVYAIAATITESDDQEFISGVLESMYSYNESVNSSNEEHLNAIEDSLKQQIDTQLEIVKLTKENNKAFIDELKNLNERLSNSFVGSGAEVFNEKSFAMRKALIENQLANANVAWENDLNSLAKTFGWNESTLDKDAILANARNIEHNKKVDMAEYYANVLSGNVAGSILNEFSHVGWADLETVDEALRWAKNTGDSRTNAQMLTDWAAKYGVSEEEMKTMIENQMAESRDATLAARNWLSENAAYKDPKNRNKVAVSEQENPFYTVDTETGEVIFDSAQYWEEYSSDLDAAFTRLEEYQELVRSYYELYLSGQEEIMNLYNDEIAKLTSINSILTNSANLWKTIGKDSASYAGTIKDYYQTLTNNSAYSYELSVAKMRDAQQEYDRVMALGAKASKEQLDTVRANLESATEEVASSAESWMESIKTQFSETLQATIDEFSMKASGMDFNTMSQAWELENAIGDRYLDEVNEAYARDKLNREIQKSIDETDNIAAQNKLIKTRIEIEEELTKVKERQGKLSQYDIDRANALYDLTLKQIALEEAQQTANKMKLTRDAMGNYTYQYVADQEAISKAEEELAAAQNELYNIDKDRKQELIDEWFSKMSDYQSKMSEAIASGNEELQASIQEAYFGQHGFLRVIQDELGIVSEESSEIASLFSGTATRILNINLDGEDGLAAFTEGLLGETQTSLATATETIADVLTKTGEGSFTYSLNQLNSGLTMSATVIQNAADSIQENIADLLVDLNKYIAYAQSMQSGLTPYSEEYYQFLKDNADMDSKNIANVDKNVEKICTLFENSAYDTNGDGKLDSLWMK